MIISLSCGYQQVFIFPSFVFVMINFLCFFFVVLGRTLDGLGWLAPYLID